MKERQYFVIILLATALIMAGLSMENVLSESDNSVESFRNALKKANITELRSLISANGLILARSYTQSNQNRGANILIKVSDIPGNFQIPAANDLPFDLRYLFGGTIRSKSLVYLDEKLAGSGTPEDSIPAIRNFAQKVIEQINQKTPSFTPTVAAVGNHWLVLSEAESSKGLLSGSLAVFEKQSGSYYLRMVIDLR